MTSIADDFDNGPARYSLNTSHRQSTEISKNRETVTAPILRYITPEIRKPSAPMMDKESMVASNLGNRERGGRLVRRRPRAHRVPITTG